MKKLIISAAIIISVLVPVFADQAAWITKDEAERGVRLLKGASEIRHYCALCDDNFYKTEKISTVSFAKAEGSSPGDPYYEIRVNGNSIDLAYVYCLSGGKWTNVAMLLKIDVTGVPKFLPEDLRDEDSFSEDINGEGMSDYEGPDYPHFEEGK